ncbi:Two-component system sensor histidine kinase [Olavius algarvensis Delta 1 endosymbiont]|nr:Two-component system sensor histidine kinase [Olavius algarvensis Delta 1 endosymbiont]
MSLKTRLIDVYHTLAFRLTLWYAGIFMVSACVAFFLFCLLITSVIRQQTDQALLSEVRTFSSILSGQGTEAVKRQAFIQAQAAGEKKIFFRMLYITGQVFSSSNMSYWQDIGISRDAVNRLLESRVPIFDTINLADRKHQIRVLYAVVGPGMIMQLGQSMENHTRIIEVFRRVFIITMVVLLAAAVVVGWFMARRALVGVETVTRTARRISDGSLEKRVPVKKRVDEIDQLALTFNQMLDRIETLVKGIKEMSDNIAHDLKSPITRIRGTAEVSLTSGSSLKEYQSMAAGTIEECDRLLDMINTMLFISRTEAGVNQLDCQQVDITALVRDACDIFQSPAEDKRIALVCGELENISIKGDMRLIQRLVANLLDNAINYTPAQGRIDVMVSTGVDHGVQIMVEDNGIGISGGDLEKIFERFYRCDPSRSQAGTGLGLSFARAAARAHGGEITVTSEVNKGSTFVVVLPKQTWVDAVDSFD